MLVNRTSCRSTMEDCFATMDIEALAVGVQSSLLYNDRSTYDGSHTFMLLTKVTVSCNIVIIGNKTAN